MKIQLKILCCTFLLCVISLSQASAMMPYGENNDTRVNKVYEQLPEEEKFFFIKLSGETLNAGYYSQLEGLAHKTEIAHMKKIIDGNVRTMKRSRQYSSILRTAGADQQHIVRHFEQCYKMGTEHAHHANRNRNGASLRPGDIYASLCEEKVPVALPALPQLPSGEQVVRVLSISFLILLTLAAIAGLIGACVCPQLPVFGRLRTLLEY